MSEASYLLADEVRRRQYQAFYDGESPADLRGELALSRLITQEAANRGDHGLALAALNITGKLASSHTAAQIRCSDLLERATVMRLGHQLITALVEELQAVDGWESIVARVADRLGHVVEMAGNEPLLLKGPEHDSSAAKIWDARRT
jgi:hypothetical protein